MTEDFEKKYENTQAAPENNTPQEGNETPQTPYQAPQAPYQAPQTPYSTLNYNSFQQPYSYQPSWQTPQQHPQGPKKNHTALAIVLVSVMWLAILGVMVYFWLSSGNSRTTTPDSPAVTSEKKEREEYPAPQINKVEGYTGEALEGVQIYDSNLESVVFVEATGERSTSLGSGFVIDASNGYLLTNYHVIKNAQSVAVTLSNRETYKAEVVGGDEVNDIAVLKIEATGLKQVTIGNSDNLKIGYDLYVIGHPLGDLAESMTRGVISSLNRQITTESEYAINTFQTDAAINSGNSGGPAFDPSGAVVGIASAKYAAVGAEGICYCIPINDAMRVAEDLIAYGYVKGRPNFGVTVSTSQGYAVTYDRYGRRTVQETVPGAVIEEIGKGSAAEKAGLQVGDIVTKLNDTRITTAMGLINAKNQHKAGDTVTLEIYRDGETLKLELTLDEYTPD